MSRAVFIRYTIKGTLEVVSPLHVGGLDPSFATDLPLARDGMGRLYVPGTSLAGPLRSWWSAAIHEADADFWWGERKNPQHASWITLADAVVAEDARLLVEVRDGVGIDRIRAAAADRIKFDRAVLPVGARFGFELIADSPWSKDENTKNEDRRRLRLGLAGLMRMLVEDGLDLGAAKTRGLGRVRLARTPGPQIVQTAMAGIDLLKQPQRFDFRGFLGQVNQPLPSSSGRMTVTIEWKPDGAVMQKASHEGERVDTVPLTAAANANGTRVSLVLQGAGIKGAFRAHAERIVRTCLDIEPEPDFLAQLSKVPLTREVFGDVPVSPKAGRANGAAGGGPEPGLGALRVGDVRSKNTWQPDEIEPDDDPKRRTRPPRDDFVVADHVAIDRFTGGAADGFLFDVLEPRGDKVGWMPIELTLQFQRLPARLQEPAVALLCLLLDDLRRGRIRLGFAAGRGMGLLTVDKVTVAMSGRIPDGVAAVVDGLAGVEDWQGSIASMPPAACAALRRAWAAWLSQEAERLAQSGNAPAGGSR